MERVDLEPCGHLSDGVLLSIDKVRNGVGSRSDGTVLKRYAPSDKLEIIEDDLATRL